MNISSIRKLVDDKKIKWTTHCMEKMGERDISITDVKYCIANGEIIEDYPDDYPYPSCLIYGINTCNKVIHVVVGSDGKCVYIITAYTPNNKKFEEDMKTRRN